MIFSDDPAAVRNHGSPGRVLSHSGGMSGQRPAANSGRRTADDLREMLFAEIAALRSGLSDHTRAAAVAKLAAQIVNVTRLEIDHAKLVSEDPKLASRAPMVLGRADD